MFTGDPIPHPRPLPASRDPRHLDILYGPRPICFSAHWCADYSKYRGFLAGGISTASSVLPFLEHGLAAKTLISHQHNTASYTGYRTSKSLLIDLVNNNVLARNSFSLNR